MTPVFTSTTGRRVWRSKSVRFGLTAAGAWMGSQIRGVLVVSELPYLRSRSSTKAVVLEGKDANAWKLLSPILESKMGEYVFAESGTGCRYWLLEVVELWKSTGLVYGGVARCHGEGLGQAW